MKTILKALFLLILSCSATIFCMQPAGQNPDLNQDLDGEEIIMRVDQTGVYEFNLKFDLKNSGPQETATVELYVNNNHKRHKNYTVPADSTLSVHERFQLLLQGNDIFDIRFNAPETIDAGDYGLAVILLDPNDATKG